MKIYLSGKITGLDKEVYTRQFERAEIFYKTSGFDVINPVKIGEEVLKINPKAEWQDFMIRDLEALKTCTHIALLEGWEESKGAKKEKAEAEKMGLEIMYLKFYGGRK
jgi:hypothetical protein